MVKIELNEAKNKLEEIITKAKKGEEFSIIVNGQPMADIVPPRESSKSNAFERLEQLKREHPIGTAEEILSWKNEGRMRKGKFFEKPPFLLNLNE